MRRRVTSQKRTAPPALQRLGVQPPGPSADGWTAPAASAASAGASASASATT